MAIRDELDWIRSTYQYREYYSDKKRIIVGCYADDYNTFFVKYIELDRDGINFFGIRASSDFEDVKQALGETNIYEVQDGLPGLITYELRYQIEWYSSVYMLRVYSYDEEGNGGIHMSFVTENDPKCRTVRITPEQIGQYFNMTKEELITEVGSDYIVYSDMNVSYEQYGASFHFSEDGQHLNTLSLDDFYQINDLKQGYSMDAVMEILGQKDIHTVQTSEDGPIYSVQYDYDTFELMVWHLFMEDGWGTYWTMRSPGYDGLW